MKLGRTVAISYANARSRLISDPKYSFSSISFLVFILEPVLSLRLQASAMIVT